MKTLRTYLFLLAASSMLTLAAAPANKTLLFVGQAKAASDVVASDASVQAHLAALGFTVTFADQREPAAAAAGKDVIVISAGVSAHVVEGKYKASPVPIVTWESYLLPHMGMTGKKEETDFGTREGKIATSGWSTRRIRFPPGCPPVC